jgi:SP family myo-inositol transporter-like MFS transporter 13
MMEFFTPVGTFALYAIVCCVAWTCIWKIYPETAGLSLEDVGGLLKDGWGVERSLRERKRRRNERRG